MFKNQLIKNTSMLYLLNSAKMLFPFLTFPYLTRVLSVDVYALIVYIKAVMNYLQIWVDFGFMLSATKDIVKVKNNSKTINQIVSDTILARLILGIVGVVIIGMLGFAIPIIRENMLFTSLSYVTVLLSCFMTDYLFRGLEKMQEITVRFITMKSISTSLTFVLVRSDEDLFFIPILDILSSIVALILIHFQLKKYNVCLIVPSWKKAWAYLKESAEYFASSIATTAFGALNTILIGIFLTETDIAIWAVALQLISIIQMCYSPIIDGVYPEMMRNKSFNLIKKLLFIFVPIVFIGCVICYFLAPLIIYISVGSKYTKVVPIFRLLIPVLLFSFPAMLCGWPTLGAIGKVRQTTLTTIISALTQCIGLSVLIVGGVFTLPLVAIVRNITEGVLFSMRVSFVIKYKRDFN